MMKLEDVTYGYETGTPVVLGVSFAVSSGEHVAVVGHNGSGKSTLLRLMCGLLSARSGLVRAGGRPVEMMKSSQRARHVSILFQNPDDQIFKGRVADELRFGPLLSGMDPGDIDERMHHAAALCSIDGTLDRNPYDLSRAQRKRLCLASVLMMETPLVLLDEPMAGQDPAGREAVMRAMDSLRVRGVSVVAVTHDMDVAAGFDRIMVLEEGRLKAEGAPRDLFSHACPGLHPPDTVALGWKLGLPGVCLTERDVLERLIQHVKAGS